MACVKNLKIENLCCIPLEWTFSFDECSDSFDLLVDQRVIEPLSECVIPIKRKPVVPGIFSEKIHFNV